MKTMVSCVNSATVITANGDLFKTEYKMYINRPAVERM